MTMKQVIWAVVIAAVVCGGIALFMALTGCSALQTVGDGSLAAADVNHDGTVTAEEARDASGSVTDWLPAPFGKIAGAAGAGALLFYQEWRKRQLAGAAKVTIAAIEKHDAAGVIKASCKLAENKTLNGLVKTSQRK